MSERGTRGEEPAAGRRIVVDEPREVPLLSRLFGFGAMVPLVLGALLAWFAGGILAALAVNLSILWGAAILLFLAGVRRGVSFRTPGGPTVGQLGAMLFLFLTGLAALLAVSVPVTPVAVGPHVLAFALLLLGYGGILVIDPIAASRGEAPLFFRRLRPVQMGIAVAALAALLARFL